MQICVCGRDREIERGAHTKTHTKTQKTDTHGRTQRYTKTDKDTQRHTKTDRQFQMGFCGPGLKTLWGIKLKGIAFAHLPALSAPGLKPRLSPVAHSREAAPALCAWAWNVRQRHARCTVAGKIVDDKRIRLNVAIGGWNSLGQWPTTARVRAVEKAALRLCQDLLVRDGIGQLLLELQQLFPGCLIQQALLFIFAHPEISVCQRDSIEHGAVLHSRIVAVLR